VLIIFTQTVLLKIRGIFLSIHFSPYVHVRDIFIFVRHYAAQNKAVYSRRGVLVVIITVDAVLAEQPYSVQFCSDACLPECDYVTFGSLLSQIRLSSRCLSSVTFVRLTQRGLKVSVIFLRHFVP